MAKYLTMTARQICYAAAFFMGGHTFAQALPDPTRPPDAAPVGSASGASDSAAHPQLQSVLISSRRVEAIVNGKTVKIGDKVGDAHVVKISENEVVLRNGQNLDVLKLFPDIEKKRAGFSRGGTGVDNRRQ